MLLVAVASFGLRLDRFAVGDLWLLGFHFHFVAALEPLADDLQVQFSKATEASNRAVMSDADGDSTAAVREAEQATQTVLREVEQLRTVLMSMGYSQELELLDAFTKRFAERSPGNTRFGSSVC